MELTGEEWAALTAAVGLPTTAAASDAVTQVQELAALVQNLTVKIGDIAEVLVSEGGSGKAVEAAARHQQPGWLGP